MSYVVHINGNDYPVAAAHVDSLRAHLLSAARAGGGFVDLPLPTRPGTAALVFPESSVWIEPAPREITAERANDLPQAVFIDIDEYPFPI